MINILSGEYQNHFIPATISVLFPPADDLPVRFHLDPSIMNAFLQVTGIVLAIVSVLMSVFVLISLRPRLASPPLWAVKVFTSALAPFFAAAGALSVLLGLTAGPLWSALFGAASTFIFLQYLSRVNASMKSPTGFAGVYGADWEDQLRRYQNTNFLVKPMSFQLPEVPESAFTFTQNISFCTIPGTSRQLLCDLWQPANNVKPSGLAFIYFHGSAWVFWDKDAGTRSFFKHLVAQGHVIMDVAYRLFPEADMTGMVNDVYRAIAWMKVHAPDYRVDADKILIGGGSAGGHLSLLAAYNNGKQLIPEELKDVDLSVQAVISLYGPPDVEDVYYHNGQDTVKPPQARTKREAPTWIKRMMGPNFHRLGMDKNPAMMPDILGCRPEECPDVYDSFSPSHYVHEGCPPSLLIQGEHDLITPAASLRRMHKRLTDAGVPAVMYILPQTDHAFDLVLARISPVAHTVFYLVERFLALQVKRMDDRPQQKASVNSPWSIVHSR